MIKITKKSVSYEFSSVQFNLPKKLAEKVIAWGRKNIPDTDLYTKEKRFGRENEIHVTIKYGLHTTDIRKIENIVGNFGSFDIVLGDISRFVPKNKEYDVVKVEIDGPKLLELHNMLSDLPNSDEHDHYRAHCTIAYIKKGCCSELSGNSDLNGETATVDQLLFSSKNGDKSEVCITDCVKLSEGHWMYVYANLSQKTRKTLQRYYNTIYPRDYVRRLTAALRSKNV